MTTSRSDEPRGARRTMRTMSTYQSILLGKWLEGNREALERAQASYDAAARLASAQLGFEVPASWFATICKQMPALRWQRTAPAPRPAPDCESLFELVAEQARAIETLTARVSVLELKTGVLL